MSTLSQEQFDKNYLSFPCSCVVIVLCPKKNDLRCQEGISPFHGFARSFRCSPCWDVQIAYFHSLFSSSFLVPDRWPSNLPFTLLSRWNTAATGDVDPVPAVLPVGMITSNWFFLFEIISGCASIINYPLPAAGTAHGCPFKVLDGDMMKKLLECQNQSTS